MSYYDQILIANKIATGLKEVKEFDTVVTDAISSLDGLGKATITKLCEAGITTKNELDGKTNEEISLILTNPLQQKSVLNFLNRI